MSNRQERFRETAVDASSCLGPGELVRLAVQLN
jgi:hypothetical protein